MERSNDRRSIAEQARQLIRRFKPYRAWAAECRPTQADIDLRKWLLRSIADQVRDPNLEVLVVPVEIMATVVRGQLKG